jgi:hypothetical protein
MRLEIPNNPTQINDTVVTIRAGFLIVTLLKE